MPFDVVDVARDLLLGNGKGEYSLDSPDCSCSCGELHDGVECDQNLVAMASAEERAEYALFYIAASGIVVLIVIIGVIYVQRLKADETTKGTVGWRTHVLVFVTGVRTFDSTFLTRPAAPWSCVHAPNMMSALFRSDAFGTVQHRNLTSHL